MFCLGRSKNPERLYSQTLIGSPTVLCLNFRTEPPCSRFVLKNWEQGGKKTTTEKQTESGGDLCSDTRFSYQAWLTLSSSNQWSHRSEPGRVWRHVLEPTNPSLDKHIQTVSSSVTRVSFRILSGSLSDFCLSLFSLSTFKLNN